MSNSATKIAPRYKIIEDLAGGIIRMRVCGFFDIQTLNSHFAENRLVVERYRAHDLAIRVFIDAVNLCPHSPEGQAIVEQAMAAIYMPKDKVAILASSRLVKMQMRRALLQGDVISFFTSEPEALAWLHHHER